jgi:hypothetical protein
MGTEKMILNGLYQKTKIVMHNGRSILIGQTEERKSRTVEGYMDRI